MNASLNMALITRIVKMQSCTTTTASFDCGDLVVEVEHTTEMQAGVYGGSPYDDGVGAVCEITSTTVYDETGSVVPANISNTAFDAMETAITKWAEK